MLPFTLLFVEAATAGTCLNAAPPYDVPAQNATVTLQSDCSGVSGQVNVTGNVEGPGTHAILDGTGTQGWGIVVTAGQTVSTSSGSPPVEFLSPDGSVENFGTIEQLGSGVSIRFNDLLHSSGPGHVINRSFGVISTDSNTTTIEFQAGGTLVNESDALIENPTGIAINVINGPVDIDNDGLIQALTLQAVASNAGGTVVNSGTIDGMLNFYTGGALEVTNTSSGQIVGSDGNAAIRAYLIPATIRNAGSIAAGTGSADAITLSSEDDVLELQPGSSVTGNVLASTGWDLLRFTGMGGDSFSLDDVGAGNKYQDFELLELESGSWTFSGTMAEDFSLTDGFMDLGDGTVTVGDYLQLGGSVVNGTLVATLFAVESGEALATLSGGGALEKSGPGSFVLQGANDYSGGTIVHEGTLTGNSNSLQGDIANNATLSFVQAGPGTYSGEISGSGLVVKDGLGPLALTGPNDYSGGTLVAAGTLVGNAASLQGDFVVDGGLQFAQSGAGVFSGDVSGTGWLSKTGPGTLLMTGTNSHTGGTLVSNGILRGDTGSLQGNIANNAELVFEQTSPGNHSGLLTGSGLLRKEGGSLLRLLGNSTGFQGMTEVVEGTLVVDGALGSASHQMDVSNGAILAGTGSVGGTVVMLDARLAPGNGVGVLTIDGDLTLDATSILDFELDQPGGTNDRLVVNGDLHLDGTLQVADQGGYGQGEYILVEYAGALVDAGLAVDNAPAGLGASIDTSVPGQVKLVIAQPSDALFSDRFEQ